MTYGEFPLDGKWDAKRALPAGVILNRDLTHIEPVDLNDPAQVEEFISHFLVRLLDRGGRRSASV